MKSVNLLFVILIIILGSSCNTMKKEKDNIENNPLVQKFDTKFEVPPFERIDLDHFLPENLDLKYKGPNTIPCNISVKKGEQLGYFQHGSTIIVFSTNKLKLAENIAEGQQIKMGESLFISAS